MTLSYHFGCLETILALIRMKPHWGFPNPDCPVCDLTDVTLVCEDDNSKCGAQGCPCQRESYCQTKTVAEVWLKLQS